MFGTASTVRNWLLIEHDGPWGERPILDTRLPRGLVQELVRIDHTPGVRVLLIRKHRRSGGTPTRCFAIRSGPGECWVQCVELEDVGDVLDLDLVALSEGRDPGLEPVPEPLFLVCTHGRRDPCCAERGRPLARALAEAEPEATWESTHVGGDRFAGNVVAFPHGLYFGRVTPAEAAEVANAYRRGEIALAHYRGRSCDPMIVQAAEHFVREELQFMSVDEVRPVRVRREGEQAT
ncbi:MAG TPA: sucrase ferredoxin, partial [Actinomycetota bacterium]|nr:sucrase ferredoxin [Actinomycetota bacterium]